MRVFVIYFNLNLSNFKLCFDLLIVCILRNTKTAHREEIVDSFSYRCVSLKEMIISKINSKCVQIIAELEEN